MSNTTIDQLLRFTTPTPTGRDLSRSSNASGDLFREHLERASDSSEAKLPTVRDSDEPGRERAPVEEDDPLETQSEQQETSTSEPKEPQATTESPEKAKSTEGTQEAAEAGDELTLSATVVAETDGTTVDSANSVEAESQTSTSISQNPEGGQPTANSTNANTETNTEADTEANSATTATSAVDPRSLEGETGQEGPDTANRTDSDAREGSRSPKTQASNSLPNASADPSETKDANAKSIAAGQSQGTDASEVLFETEAGESSANSRGDGKSDGPVSALAKHDTSTTVDTEFTDATKQLGASDTTPAASNAWVASRGSESVAGLEPSLGSASTGKATSPTNAANGQEPTGMPTIDRARFVQRVGGAIRTAQQRDGQIQLRLSPPELGSLRIQITINEGVVTARLEAETAAARTVLLDNLPALRERLAEQQVRIEKFDVDVRQEGQETPDNSGAQERQANRSRAQTNKTTQRVPTARSATKEADSNHSGTDSGLDVRI